MITIEILDPTGEDKPEDDMLLITLLSSLIKYSAIHNLTSLQFGPGIQKTYHEKERNRASILIDQVYPLLGLTLDEVVQLLMKAEE